MKDSLYIYFTNLKTTPMILATNLLDQHVKMSRVVGKGK